MVEDRRRCGWGTVLAAVALCATVLLAVPAAPATAAGGGEVQVVVREAGPGGAPEALVERLGGTVGRQLRVTGKGVAGTAPMAHGHRGGRVGRHRGVRLGQADQPGLRPARAGRPGGPGQATPARDEAAQTFPLAGRGVERAPLQLAP